MSQLNVLRGNSDRISDNPLSTISIPREASQLLRTTAAHSRPTVAIVGLGYVGLPLLVGMNTAGFRVIGVNSWFGVPVAIWIMIVVAAIAILITTRTPFGRRVYAVGGNERAAELSGIRTGRIKLGVYIISGICAALAGMILTSELGAAYPDTATTYELNAIAAAVLGGTSLFGGKGTIIGTVMGAFVIGFLSDGLVLVGVSSFWQLVVKGSVIILAVVLEQSQARLKLRLAG